MSGLAACAGALRPGRTLLLQAVYDPSGALFPSRIVYAKEATVVAFRSYHSFHGAREFDSAAGFLASHPELSHAIVSHRFTFDDALAAFTTASDRAAGSIKVLLHA